jgi:uncharacterized protein YqjF (DUF2071 family)
MRWCDLAFLHWPVPARVLRPLIPTPLELETFDGSAWVGVVPFRMEGVRLRGVPPIPTTHAFPEINVRTYVRADERAGVWFFSLDASSRLAVRGARLLYNLPYYDADIEVRPLDRARLSDGLTPHASRAESQAVDSAGGAGIRYHGHRVHRDAPSAEFEADYAPAATTASYEASPGTLEHFLVERYCLFTYDRRRGLGLIDVDHASWQLQRGTAAIRANTMALAAGIRLPEIEPVVHVTRDVDVRAWTRQPIAA